MIIVQTQTSEHEDVMNLVAAKDPGTRRIYTIG